MKQSFKFFFASILIISSVNTFSNQTIKMAIFDNPQIDFENATVSSELQNAYMNGVNTAIHTASSKGITIDQQTFFFDSNLLHLFQQIPYVESWNPDVVIGLHSSNQLLMARNFFKNNLVLSIFATDPDLSQLPTNFYSLGVPDQYTANNITNFVNQYYPKSNIFILIGAESKESVDMANLLTNIYAKNYPEKSVIQSKFISDDLDTTDIKSLMNGYKAEDVIIILADTYYTQLDLMSKVSTLVKPTRPVFITDVDNWNGNITPGGAANGYDAFRIAPLLPDKKSKDYIIFLKNYGNYSGHIIRGFLSTIVAG